MSTIKAAFVAHQTAEVSKVIAMTWAELSAMLSGVKIGVKAGPGWMPADMEPGARHGDRVKATTALVLDVEADTKGDKETGIKTVIGPEPMEPEVMQAELALFGHACILHTSHTHHDQTIQPIDQSHPRYRLVFQLSRELGHDEIKPLGLHVAGLLGIGDCLDTKCLEPARLYYLPRCPKERIDDFFHADVDGEPLDVDALLSAARQEAAALTKATRQKHGKQTVSVIDSFNQAHDIGAILEAHGYIAKGRNRWLYPDSTTGMPGARKLPKTTPERIYSSHGGDPLNDGHAHDAFDCFRIIKHGGDTTAAIKEAAWILGLSDARQGVVTESLPDIDPSMLMDQAPGDRTKDQQHDAPDYPPGLAGDVARYIFGSSRMPIKSFAIAGALTAISFLNANKRYVGPSNTALNLYQCLTGETGRGKEGPRQAVKRLFDESLLSYAGIHETVSSSTALLRALEADKQALILTDEFGLFLQVALSDRGSAHLKELVKELMSLYGLGRSYYAGKRYAEERNNIGRISRPYVDLLATTTPVELLNGITANSVDNGFLNRILFVQADYLHPVNRSPATGVPDALKASITAILTQQPGPLEYDSGAEQLMIQLSDGMAPSGQYGNLWARAEEQLVRVAGLLAIDGGLITKSHIQWAGEYVDWSIRTFAKLLGAELTETVFQKHVVKAVKYIENATVYSDDTQFRKLCKRGLMPRGKLLKLMKMPKREVDDVIEHLVESGQIAANKCDGFVVYHSPSRILDSLGGKAA